MCRARPGPRCSDTGTTRYNTAIERVKYLKRCAEREAEAHPQGALSARRKLQLANSERRLEAARRVFFATPAGQKHLDDRIEATELELDNLPESDDLRSDDARKRVKLTALLDNLKEEKHLGVTRRSNSYADLHMVGDERRRLRDESRERGGQMNKRGHPYANPTGAHGTPRTLQMKTWELEDVTRANSWVESGANPGWVENSAARVPSVVEGISIGSERVVPSQSRVIRLNLPDGQVVEARYDFHVTKNEDGRFIVSSKRTVSSSWEDAAPIDVTTQNLGHILTARSGVSRRQTKAVVGSYDTKEKALFALNEAKQDTDLFYAQDTAITARESLVARARNTTSELQQRKLPVWFRYQHSPQEFAQVNNA